MTLWDIYEKSTVFNREEGGMPGKEKASMFVCGIVLREVFCPKLQITYPVSEYSWEQLWYLACLYHDRRFEQSTLWKLTCEQSASMGRQEIWEAQNIGTNTGWTPMKIFFSPVFTYGKKGIVFSNGACVRESPVSETEIKDRFYYRNTCCRQVGMEHGIVGGLLLYDHLLFRHWEEKNGIKGDKLHLYSYFANLLMGHHLIKGTEDALFEKNPGLFFLVLAEALEPLHYVRECYTARDVLNSIRVQLFEKEIVLCIKDSVISSEEYFACVSSAAKKTGMQCICREDLSEIRMKMSESAIIDELFI